MERNKRNSIAGFPTRAERANEEWDGAAGFGLGEMGVNAPSQVSGALRLPGWPRAGHSALQSGRRAGPLRVGKSMIQS